MTSSVTYQFKIFKTWLIHNKNWLFWVLLLHFSETKTFLLFHYDIYTSWKCLSKAMFFLQNHNLLKGSYRSLWNGVVSYWIAAMTILTWPKLLVLKTIKLTKSLKRYQFHCNSFSFCFCKNVLLWFIRWTDATFLYPTYVWSIVITCLPKTFNLIALYRYWHPFSTHTIKAMRSWSF